jgi:thiamine biosynthesis lipoprotein
VKARCLCALLLALLLLAGCAQAGPWETELTAMDTFMKLTVYGSGGEQAGKQAAARIRELESLLSTTDAGSEIYAANHTGSADLSEDTAALLGRALSLCADTGGLLDVTIYPVVRTWGFTTGDYQVPDRETLDKLLERVDYRTVSLAGGRLTLPDGVEVDLGAVAKGYAGDQLMALFRDEGVTSAIVELGGNVQTLGVKPDGSPWRVAVQSPDGDGYAGVLEIADKAVVTSGGYQRYFEQDGETYWHIIDPRTGCPARSGVLSVTVVADEGVVCDALSTALFVMGPEEAAAYWRMQGGFEYILIDEAGAVTITEGLEGCFSLYGSWEGRPLSVARR